MDKENRKKYKDLVDKLYKLEYQMIKKPQDKALKDKEESILREIAKLNKGENG